MRHVEGRIRVSVRSDVGDHSAVIVRLHGSLLPMHWIDPVPARRPLERLGPWPHACHPHGYARLLDGLREKLRLLHGVMRAFEVELLTAPRPHQYLQPLVEHLAV